jgi:hypothetical protein
VTIVAFSLSAIFIIKLSCIVSLCLALSSIYILLRLCCLYDSWSGFLCCLLLRFSCDLVWLPSSYSYNAGYIVIIY